MSGQTMRGIPPVHRFLSDPRLEPYGALVGKGALKRAVASALDGARKADGVPVFDALCAQIAESLEREHAAVLRRIINATGILLHTNFGRAPIAAPAIEALREVACGYSNLEYDLDSGRRGSRYERANTMIREVTGAQDALVVNNCAAAVLLIVDTFARGRQVVIARNQLIEVGGGFRLADVLERSGATLIEVGAANKVYLQDFERALTPDTALLMRSHPSNYRITGYTHDVEPRALCDLGRRAGVPVVEDLGSGAVIDLARYGIAHERTVQEAIADGFDLVAFSGDKLLGGPQAGIIAGRSAAVSRLRNNPLLRALRVGKSTLALLIGTLRLYLNAEGSAQIPLLRMLSTSIEELEQRAGRYQREVQHVNVVRSTAYMGGGTLPEQGFASVAIMLDRQIDASTLAQSLRRSPVPIAGRIDDGRFLLDLRTVQPADDAYVIERLQKLDA